MINNNRCLKPQVIDGIMQNVCCWNVGVGGERTMEPAMINEILVSSEESEKGVRMRRETHL